jgi:ABC-type dipeptide/oligopeptide/nickel transport system ATPase component
LTGTSESQVFLKVEGLKTYFDTDRGTARAVDGIDFEILAERPWGWWGNRGAARA